MGIRLDPQTDEPPLRARTLSPKEGTPLYVHLPYCVTKCTYCDFFSVAAEGEDLEGTLAAVLTEADKRAPESPSTVFLGGGTPSLYSKDQLKRLLDGLNDATGFRNSATEVTLECNPESLDREKAALLVDLGVDRVSIGVQSLRPEILRLFERVHDRADALRAYDDARAAGVPRVSLDVIYAVPGQSLDQWLRDLEILLDLGPDHMSAYHLAYEPGTLLTKWVTEGRLERLDEELELAFFRRTRERLAEAGLPGYELSNFGSPTQECRHNRSYWLNRPYVGIGPSAVSYLEGTRFGNPRSITGWRRSVREGRLAATWEETLSPEQALGETWWLGLRTSHGVDPDAARLTARYRESRDPCLRLAEDLLSQGWLERAETQAGRLRISEQHLPLADELSRRFLSATS